MLSATERLDRAVSSTAFTMQNDRPGINTESEMTLLRPSRIEIDLTALSNNFKQLSDFVSPATLMPVLKSNAYGHGLVECAALFSDLGARYFCVAYLEEALALRNAEIQARILPLGGISKGQIELFLEHDLDLTASSIDKLRAIETLASKTDRIARVHLKVDTGMNRIGIRDSNCSAFFAEAARCEHCEIVGLFSHFAFAESEDVSFSEQQLVNFLRCEKELREALGDRVSGSFACHISNSGSLLQLKSAHLGIVRPGLALYGSSPNRHQNPPVDLRPALTLRSEVCFFKVVKAGSGVGYGHTWKAEKDTRIVTVPLGYGDGYSRRLGNRGFVLIRGKRYPIVGTVCMDQFMVDIGTDGEAYNGDEVVLIGRQGSEEITLHEVADWLETDPREVLSQLNTRLPRVYERSPLE